MPARPPPLPSSASVVEALPADEELVPLATPADDADDDTDDDATEWQHVENPGLWRFLVGLGSCGFSMLVHLAVLILLAYLTVPNPVQEVKTLVEAAFDTPVVDEPVEFELDRDIQAMTDPSQAIFSSAPAVGMAVGVGGSASAPQLDAAIVKQAAEDARFADIQIEDPLAGAPSFHRLIDPIPEGEFKGDPRQIIDDYQQAMDRIAQELMWMMDKGPVLVIWAFDESESMKDDQQEIRDRVYNVYVQLGLVGRDAEKWLTTSVVSYGEGYRLHTTRPTADIMEIRQAIEAVPVDHSGKELMCQAVGRAVFQHREYARTNRRQMVIILVTDESGEREDNLQYLEQAIADAKAAKCRVYVLGRESVFGYPLAYMWWEHPQTHHIHWLPVDRGPESAFVEQLQVDGFRRRHDAFPSGFGSYEQCRMVRETGGVFFMLPGLESSIVRGEKRHYELEVMRPYRPDLRARVEALADRDRYPLRTIIWQCIYDLNPIERPEIAGQVEMRMHFAPTYPEFVRQARMEQAKAREYLIYLARVQKALEKGAVHRRDEADPRWQANYDLIYAQLIAYQARIWEYGASLEAFIKNPSVVPLTKPPDLHLVHWNVAVRKETLTKESKPYIERAREVFELVMQNHPGTPWAARADGELTRGFGVDFQPEYHRPDRSPPGGVTVPIPKL